MSDNREMINACYARLMDELGVFGEHAVRIITEELGGLMVHVPSQRTLEIECRDAAIRNEFTGVNIKELSLKFGIETRRIRQILFGG